MIEPLVAAKENYVRQGAVIALAFIMIQQTENTCPKVKEFRQTLIKMITEKGEESITKFGAILAQGILDAGGRNVTIGLHNRNGHSDLSSVVGVFGFLQHWYWHSLAHLVSLSFRPTCLVGLNANLDMPKMEFRCNARPSMFAYPPPMEEKKKDDFEKKQAAILSFVHKKLADDAVKDEDESAKVELMDVDETAKMDDKKEVEPNFQTLQNPARVVRLQLKCLSMPENSRYKPLKPLSQGGIIMLRDRRQEEQEEIVPLEQVRSQAKMSLDEETESHSTFEINFDDY